MAVEGCSRVQGLQQRGGGSGWLGGGKRSLLEDFRQSV